MVAIVEQVVELTEPGSRRRATALGWLTVELAVGPEMRRAHHVGCEALAIARRLDAPALLAPNPADDATFLKFPAGSPEPLVNKSRVGAQ